MSYPRLKNSTQFRNLLMDWFTGLFPVKFDAGDAEHGPPPLYEKPRPLRQLRDEILDSWSYLGAAIYQNERVISILEEATQSTSRPEMKVAMARALSILRTGTDSIGD